MWPEAAADLMITPKDNQKTYKSEQNVENFKWSKIPETAGASVVFLSCCNSFPKMPHVLQSNPSSPRDVMK